MKKFISLLLSLAIICPVFADLSATSSFAADKNYPKIVSQKDIKVIPANQMTGTIIQPYSKGISTLGLVNDIYYRKVDVTYSNEWSPYKRVSDNIVTNSAGGAIAATIQVSFGTEITGDVSGINVGTNASLTTSKSYTLNAPPNSRCYMAYHVYYKVEKGTRQTCDGITSTRVLQTNKYTVKTPQYGEYVLVNY